MSNRFPTTAWSLLDEAKQREQAAPSVALNRFVVAYWRPIYFFVRARGYSVPAAEDLTQGFLLKFLQRNWLETADRSRGRFRSFLLAVLSRYLADESPQRSGKQESFDRALIPVSVLIRDEERAFEPPDDSTPDQLFMQQWARALVTEVRSELDIWCRQQGRPDWYDAFKAYHFPPNDESRPAQEQLARQFGCSRDQVRYAIRQTNQQFARLFRAAVREQVDTEEEVDAEILEIERLLG